MNRSTIIKADSIAEVNSVTYTDVAGLYAGLERFPGEAADEFLKRVESAAALNRSASYEGFLNQLNLQFGLTPKEMLWVSNSGTEFNLTVSVTGLVLVSRQESLHIPTRIVDSDNFWTWRSIGEIVADINASRTFTASLLEDGTAVQLVWQTNSRQVRNSPVSGTSFVFPEESIDPDKVVFNIAVPNWVFSENNRSLLFDRSVQDGTLITYEHRLCPYSVIGYPAAALSLTDPELAAAAVTADGSMVYQVREYLHNVSDQDRSYWGN